MVPESEQKIPCYFEKKARIVSIFGKLGLIFAILLPFIVIFLLNSSYAANRPITEEAIKWGIENIKNNILISDFLNNQSTYNMVLNGLNFMSTDTVFLRKTKNEIDNFLKNNNAENLDLTNMAIFLRQRSIDFFSLTFIFHNSTAPNDVENLPYLSIYSANIIQGRDSKDNLSNDKLLILNLNFYSNTNYTFASYNDKSIGSLKMGEIKIDVTSNNDSYAYVFKVRLASFYSKQVGYCKVPISSDTYEPGFLQVWSGDNLETGSTIDPENPGRRRNNRKWRTRRRNIIWSN